jgi:hypothetical protein
VANLGNLEAVLNYAARIPQSVDKSNVQLSSSQRKLRAFGKLHRSIAK